MCSFAESRGFELYEEASFKSNAGGDSSRCDRLRWKVVEEEDGDEDADDSAGDSAEDGVVDDRVGEDDEEDDV